MKALCGSRGGPWLANVPLCPCGRLTSSEPVLAKYQNWFTGSLCCDLTVTLPTYARSRADLVLWHNSGSKCYLPEISMLTVALSTYNAQGAQA